MDKEYKKLMEVIHYYADLNHRDRKTVKHHIDKLLDLHSGQGVSTSLVANSC